MACDLKTLLSEACANNFLQLAATDPKTARAVMLQLLCNITSGGFSASILSQTKTLDSISSSYGFSQSLATTPKYLRAVLLCVNLDVGTGYSGGDELELQGSMISNSSGGASPQVSANSTNITVSLSQPFVGHETGWLMVPKVGGGQVNPSSFNNFQLKIYYA